MSEKKARRWLMWLGVSSALAVVTGLGILAYVVRHAEPILRKRVVAYLEGRFRAPVELDGLHISVVKGLEVSGEGLRVFRLPVADGVAQADGQGGRKTLLSIDRFQFHTGVRALLEKTMRVETVRVEGMQVNIPPREERDALFPKDEKKRGLAGFKIAIGKVVCTDVALTIETLKPSKPPRVFDIQSLTLTDIAPDTPLYYEASLTNPIPRGQIDATGHFGPWQAEEPRETALDGTYTLSHADLGTIKGIGGTLSSTGKYDGTLDQIHVNGVTETPNFSLDVSEHPVPLHTEFDATVDGTSGDTTLNSVRARLAQSALEAKGTIARVLGADGKSTGHDIELTVTAGHARIEDILRLGAKTSPPLMRGALALHARLSIPPGHESVSKKIRLKGDFKLSGVTFSNPKFQDTVDKLSVRAKGDIEDAHPDGTPAVTSEMGGTFALANAVVHLPGFDYKVPGAEIHLAGDYSLSGETCEFAGTVRTKATASEMLTGWKSLLAKPFDGLLKKNGAGAEVPIKISGTREAPKVSLDFGKMFGKGKSGKGKSGKVPVQ
jgi:AsmA-like C-terminal region